MRGLSPVLSTLAMVVVAVVAGVLVYSWVVPFYQSQQQQLEGSLPQGTLKISHVWCGDGNLFVLLQSDREMNGTAWIFVEDYLGNVYGECNTYVTLLPYRDTKITCPLCDPTAQPFQYYVRAVVGNLSAREGPYQLNIS